VSKYQVLFWLTNSETHKTLKLFMEIKVYFVRVLEWFKRLGQEHEDFKDDQTSWRP